MNREQFLKSLRAELAGMAPAELDEIVADYDAYFRDAKAAGREEEDVAASLGAPRQLARELRAEARIKDWEEKRSPSNFARMFLAVAGLGFINLMLLLPLFVIGALLFASFVAALALMVAGAALVLASIPGTGIDTVITVDIGGMDIMQPLGMALAGIGVFCSGVVWFLLDLWISKWLAIGLARYARLNYRVVRGEF